jgi:hypothetical protein
MSLIDWSDPEDLFGLLVEYVIDERGDTDEPARRAFLSGLRAQLEELQASFQTLPPLETINRLRAIRRWIGGEFEADPVVEHLSACIEELERVHESAA